MVGTEDTYAQDETEGLLKLPDKVLLLRGDSRVLSEVLLPPPEMLPVTCRF